MQPKPWTLKYAPLAAAGGALVVAAGAFVESLRQRARAQEAEAGLRLYAMGDLPSGLYETCWSCGGEGKGCSVCWDVGLIEHDPDHLDHG